MFDDVCCLQDISLMIKPLPSFFHFVGFGPLNLGAFLQARVRPYTDVLCISSCVLKHSSGV